MSEKQKRDMARLKDTIQNMLVCMHESMGCDAKPCKAHCLKPKLNESIVMYQMEDRIIVQLSKTKDSVKRVGYCYAGLTIH